MSDAVIAAILGALFGTIVTNIVCWHLFWRNL